MITDKKLEELEKQYLELFFNILNKENNIKFLQDQLRKINRRLTWVQNYKPDNTIEKPLQEAVRTILLKEAIKQKWKPSTLPASSDTFFEIPKKCFINFDIKTVKMIDSDVSAIIKHVTGKSFNFKIKEEIVKCRRSMLKKLKAIHKGHAKAQTDLAYKVILQVEPNQSDYPNDKPTGSGNKEWEGPNLQSTLEKKPVFFFFIQFIWYYEKGHSGKNKIIMSTLNSVPNGKLYKTYNDIISGYKTYSTGGTTGKCARIPMEKLKPKIIPDWDRAKLLPDYN